MRGAGVERRRGMRQDRRQGGGLDRTGTEKGEVVCSGSVRCVFQPSIARTLHVRGTKCVARKMVQGERRKKSVPGESAAEGG
jgi:hypothetical protein